MPLAPHPRAVVLLVLLAAPLAAQPAPEVVATGVFGAVGLAVDADGRLWATQPGTGADDGRVVVIDAAGQPQAAIVGLPSEVGAEGAEGPTHLLFDGADLWVAVGVGSGSPRGVLYRFDTTGLGDGPPRTPADAAETVDLGAFVRGAGFAETNAYGLALGPDGALFVTDAGANAVLRRAPGGTLAVLAVLPPVPNPTPVGPPAVQMVPTGVAVVDGRLFVAAFTGSPFVEGLSRVVEVDPVTGAVSPAADGLTSTVDVVADPRDGSLVALQFAAFDGSASPPGFQPGTGRVRRLADGAVLADGLSFASALAAAADGTLYVATLGGDVVRVASAPVAADRAPADAPVRLGAPRPNPAAGRATVAVSVREPGPARLTLHDVRGREVAVLLDRALPAGDHAVAVDTARLAGGVYVVRLTAAGATGTRRMVVVR